jgi:hypothetical protein
LEARVIKDYDPKNHGITEEFLVKSNDWDLLELNYTLDIDKLKNWYSQINEKFSFMRFNFNENSDKLDVEVSKKMVEEGYCGYYCGPIDGITFSWPIERYEPLPPPQQCNPEIFPEVSRNTFFDQATIMPRMRFGYLEDMIKKLGDNAFKQMIITTHHAGMYIKQHRDSKTLKLHIPVETNSNAKFHFGINRDREYHMKLGKIYILNTGDWHGTSNDSNFSRSHIITRIASDYLLKIIGLTNE